MAHYRFDLARLRTPEHCGPGFSDAVTRVAPSAVPGAGYGIFSVVALASRMPLYEYTGTPMTAEEADKYPNAYMFSSPLFGVLDASQDICSPAKYVNTKGRMLAVENNCEFVTHEGHIFLSTTRAIGQGEELFAPYGKHTPRWPMTFLGCARAEKIEFVRYLQDPPRTATREHIQNARELLQGVLDDIQQELVELRVQSATNFGYAEIVIKHEKCTKKRLQHAQADIQKLNKVGCGTRAKLLRSTVQLVETKAELQRTGAQLADLQTQLASTRFQLEASQAELQTSRSDFKESNVKLQKTKSELEQITGQLKLTTSQLLKTNSWLHLSRTQVQGLQTQLHTATAQLQQGNEAFRQKGMVEVRLKSAQADAQRLTTQESHTRRKLEHCQTQLERVQAHLMTTNGHLQAANAKARTSQYQLREARIQLQASRDTASVQIEAIRAEAQAQVQQAKENAEARKRKTDEEATALLRETKAELEAEIAARDVKLETLKNPAAESRWKVANTELMNTVQRVRNRMYEITDKVGECVWKTSGEGRAHTLLTELYDDIMKRTAV